MKYEEGTFQFNKHVPTYIVYNIHFISIYIRTSILFS